jgi:tetratricopeptide (TPR) repeat protein
MKICKTIKIIFILCFAACSSSANFRENCCSPSPIANTYYSQGIAKRKAGEIEAAIELYQKALNVSPLFTCARVNLALLYHQAKKYDEALFEFSIAKSQQPKDSILRRSIGNVYRDLGKLDQAEQEYKNSIELDETNANSYYHLAGIYNKKKLYDQANENYVKFLSLERSNQYPKQLEYSKKYTSWYKSKKSLDNIEKIAKNFSELLKPKFDYKQCNENFSLAFVVDKSGSIRDNQVIETIKSSLSDVIPKLKSNIKLSIIAFDYAPFILSRNVTMDQEGKNTTINRIKMLYGNGQTIIIPAIDLALRTLKASNNACRSMIIISDGKFANQSEIAKDLLGKNKDIHLAVIQLGKGGSYPEMLTISRAANGTYYSVPDLKRTNITVLEVLESLKLIDN